MLHPVPLVWLVVEANNFCYVSLRHSTGIESWRLYLWWKSDFFPHFHCFQLIFSIPFKLGSDLFVGLYLNLFLFSPFIIFVGYMVHVNSIRFALHLVIGSPIPILDISDHVIHWIIDSIVFNIVKSPNITVVGVYYFSVGTGLGSFTSSSNNCCKERSLSNLFRQVVSAIILSSLGFVLVCYFASTMSL